MIHRAQIGTKSFDLLALFETHLPARSTVHREVANPSQNSEGLAKVVPNSRSEFVLVVPTYANSEKKIYLKTSEE